MDVHFFCIHTFMTYEEIWRRLTAVNEQGEAKAIARMLLEEKFDMSLADILCGGVEQLSAADVEWLEQAVSRLEHQEPIQYVLGWAWFCCHRFGVQTGVLIPRPETEWLVDRAVAIAKAAGGRQLRILDIGTGSGCIAISIKKALPEAYVEAWDISDDALAIAAANAKELEADVRLCRRDALSAEAGAERWDIIVSNPPYICDSERVDMDANVLDHEPSTALFVPDADPLLFYRAITRYALAALNEDGHLLFECNTRYAEATAQMMKSEGMGSADVADDCFGLPRFVDAVR